MSRSVPAEGRAVGVNGRSVAHGGVILDSVVLLPESDDDTHFSGDTADITIDSNAPTFGGSQNNDLSFKLAASGVIYSTSGLDNYPVVGTEFLFRFYVNDGVGCRVYYMEEAAVLSSDGYGITIRDDTGEFGFSRRDGGSIAPENTTSVTYSTGQWYTITGLHATDGSYTLELYSDYSSSPDATVTGTDSTHITSGSFDHTGIGQREFNGVQTVTDQFVADASEIN